MDFIHQTLDIDAKAELERIESFLLRTARSILRRNGAVVGISGGVDSSVVLALCARAFGPKQVTAVIMPEKESDPESENYARDVARRFGVTPLVEDITPALEGLQCYRRRDEAIRRLFPEYKPAVGYKAKITLPAHLLDQDALSVFSLTILEPDGRARTKPLPAREFRQIMSASNFKQRARMAVLYYHAEQSNFAVIGTANKNERDLGFFVKYGDGGVDVNPIAHLYKTQIYQLGRFLGIPESVLQRTPTTDTYPAPTSQEEFFFRIPFETMDLLWAAMERGIPVSEVARAMQLTDAQVMRAQKDFARKQKATEPLRLPPIDLHAPMQEADDRVAPARIV